MKETKGFSASDWHKAFTVTFIGEEALDWGGVSREFFHLLCTQCFNCSNGMFRRFKDDSQALVHPNPHHPPTVTPHHYHFAGRVVGKCLFESSLGTNLHVSAHFTRSFLAQIIGLRINYKYFESDDPDLYVSKIQYIRENGVSDLELVFAEEEFSEDGTVRVVPLEEGGEEKPVTDENKTHYLNLLAQYRLAKQTKTQVEHFVKGLHDLIPDNLLGIFDENELELLMCGTDAVSYDDLKKHAVVTPSANTNFQRVVSWFWLVVSGFAREEMARLLQFVTGSSQLPPGGFKDLSPKFQITSAPTHGRLPSAHTCFNQLCLPEYDSCEQFQTALTLALNEGTEGFGFL
ncbi:Apoptosis-resistant E3 ubiquitin protein ligase 1 [Geodia barretti]|uniref:HECT-type E3 ubiquitin transferase n=2 Tax=Geodia barretti TaxID=519541 RepID=A0AA35SIF4_GEOBA|nr:Apoptosis-resistant E3 ubiquitin protein ligase 1 [Geodia barretti]